MFGLVLTKVSSTITEDNGEYKEYEEFTRGSLVVKVNKMLDKGIYGNILELLK